MNRLVTEEVLGYSVMCDKVDSCVDAITEWVFQGNRCRLLACLNPHSYIVSIDDSIYSTAMHSVDWLIPDGVGIVLASQFQRGNIRTRVTGYDIFTGVQRRLNQTGGRVFFLGSTEETLSKIRARMAIDYPNLQIAGTFSPPFRARFSEEENAAMVAKINAAAPDVLWVGMTAPKQEKWLYENREQLKVKFAGAIGAVFDFYAGNVKRCHPFFQHLGLEWLPRLLQEPRRLWRRNLISSPKFVAHVIASRLKNGKVV